MNKQNTKISGCSVPLRTKRKREYKQQRKKCLLCAFQEEEKGTLPAFKSSGYYAPLIKRKRAP